MIFYSQARCVVPFGFEITTLKMIYGNQFGC